MTNWQLSKKVLGIVATLALTILLVPMSVAFAASEISVSSVSASSDDGNVPANTTDNNYQTRWSAEGDGSWISYDLGQMHNIERVKIAWYKGTERVSDFEIQVSSDGSNWSQVYSGSSSGTSDYLEVYHLNPFVDAQYVRIVGYGNSQNDWNSILETEIWGTPSNNGNNGGGGNGLSISSATASTYDTRCNCDASNAIDGDIGSRWSGEGNGAWITFDLGFSQTVGSMKIAFHKGDERVTSFAIETSDDNSNWTQVYNGSSSGSSLQLETFDIADATARYVRYVGFGNTQNNWNSLTEVEIYGGQIGVSCGSNNLDPNLPPGGNFDLTQWKITLPDASERTAAELTGGYENPAWFFTDANTDGMVFVSPNQEATTPNSSFTRSELREMLDPSDNSAHDLDNNFVLSTSTPSVQSQAGGIDGTMKATLIVDRVSTTGAPNGKPDKVGRVVVGQIHGPDTEPIRLYFHKRPQDSKGAIYFGTDDLSNNNTWVDVIGGPTNLNPSNGIALGEVWDYEIQVVGLNMTVKITPENGSTTTVNYTLPSGYNDKYMYFKAGVYNQNNTGDSSDYAQATFCRLTHTHP